MPKPALKKPPLKTKPTTPLAVSEQMQGEVSASRLQNKLPKLPHERDESANNHSSAPRVVMKQAAADVENGLQPTDRSTETNQAYQKLKRTP